MKYVFEFKTSSFKIKFSSFVQLLENSTHQLLLKYKLFAYNHYASTSPTFASSSPPTFISAYGSFLGLSSSYEI